MSARSTHALLLAILLLTGTAHGQTVSQMLIASLDTGTLAGTTFPVYFSYDGTQVTAQGDSYVFLRTFDFVLKGVAFTRNDIFQGGQAIFHNGKLTDVTASFQVRLPPNAPLNNITFGFGGDGVIGYIDLANNYGQGSFVFTTAAAIVNAASFEAQPLAPGVLATVFGTGMALPDTQSTSVTIGGLPSPLLYVSPAQINLQIPPALPTGPASVLITTTGFTLPPLQISIAPYSPAIFNVAGQAIAQPAKPGDYIMIFATGLGVPPTMPRVFIGGIEAQVTFSGLSPQFIGVNQINAIVPAVSAGLQPLQLEVGSVRTSDKVTIAVQ